MFKMLVLQKLYNISDEALEYQVNDRLSFMRFLGFGLEDKVPDATTVWLFREDLQKHGLIDELFEQFDFYLQQQGYAAQGGQIVDATLIPVPIQRNSSKENEQIKQGQQPQEWAETPHKARQKDIDARWTKKNNKSHFGYKNHISIDVEYGFIRGYAVSDASVHDSQMLGAVLDDDNAEVGVWADSAYRSEAIEEVLDSMGFDSHIHERSYRNRPLSEQQQQENRERSKTRAKVEHVFGDWTTSMGGKVLRTIGIERAKTNLGLKNLVYNFKRLVFWQGRSAQTVQ
jgi:IS5 family transposase